MGGQRSDDQHSARGSIIGGTPGLGKTQAVLDALSSVLAHGSAIMYVPDHTLGTEISGRLRLAELPVRQVRGRGQLDDDGTPMCHYPRLAEQLGELGLPVRPSLCETKTETGRVKRCRHFDGCRYMAQFECKDDKAVFVAPHSYLSIRRNRAPLPKHAALVVVDENCRDALLRGADGRLSLPMDSLIGPQYVMRTVKHAGRLVYKLDEEASADVSETCRCVANALVEEPTPAALRRHGVTVEALVEAQTAFDGMAAPMAPFSPDDSEQKKQTALDTLKADRMGRDNRIVTQRKALLMRLCAQALEIDLPELRFARVLATKDGRKIELAYRIPPSIGSDESLLYLDGHANQIEAVALFDRHMEVVAPQIETPHVRVTQITDRHVSKTMLAYSGDDGPERQRAKNNRRRLVHLAEVLARQHGRLLLVTYKRAAELIRSEFSSIEARDIELTHFGMLRGQDKWRDFPAVLVAGRNRPSARDLERAARALYWDDPQPMQYLPVGNANLPGRPGGLRMRSGLGVAVGCVEHHPDERINGVLDSICRCEIEQAVHRLRGIRRTIDDPATVYVATDVPLNLDIEEVTTWHGLLERADPVAVMLARGFLPKSWGGVAAVMPELFGTANAGKGWFRDNPQSHLRMDAARGRDGSNVCDSPIGLLIGISHTFAPCRIRRAGDRKSQEVMIDLDRHPDPVAAIEATFGPVDRFEIDDGDHVSRVFVEDGDI